MSELNSEESTEDEIINLDSAEASNTAEDVATDKTELDDDNSCKQLPKSKDDSSQLESSITEKKMKVVSYGTPVPTSVKPKLPSLEKWAVGMGDLLYFENLPTSTGAYKDKLKGTLEKVRNRFNVKN